MMVNDKMEKLMDLAIIHIIMVKNILVYNFFLIKIILILKVSDKMINIMAME